jgi:endonuclease-3
MEELTKLPGVGRKTANVVLGNAFGIDEGVVVDTHVTRIANRLNLTTHTKDAKKIERDLMEVVPKKDWTLFPHLMIWHGREICQARTPKCEICTIRKYCPSSRV